MTTIRVTYGMAPLEVPAADERLAAAALRAFDRAMELASREVLDTLRDCARATPTTATDGAP